MTLCYHWYTRESADAWNAYLAAANETDKIIEEIFGGGVDK